MNAIAVAAPRAVATRSDLLTVTRKHEADLLAFSETGREPAHLIPTATLAVIQEEITTALAAPSAAEREAQSEVMALVGSYPTAPANPAIYLAALNGEACNWPADVLREARRIVSRRCRFLPTVAELATACEEVEGGRRTLLKAAHQLERLAAEREREEAAHRYADEVRQLNRAALDAKLSERYGVKAPPAGSYDAAALAVSFCLTPDELPAWAAALWNGEAWAAVSARRAVIFRRAWACQNRPRGKATMTMGDLHEVSRCLANGYEDAAEELTSRGERGELDMDARGWPVGGWDAVRSMMRTAFDSTKCHAAAVAEGMSHAG
ncbi:hypothetical protein [Azospirillum sp.]|uniref:hypothetical protein n=1 Tax=Azospirillum sp. TaxID=34012 RepID=UPI003D72FFD1